MIITIAIQDLEICFDNLNLALRKNAIWFDSLAQKKKIDKQIDDTLYY